MVQQSQDQKTKGAVKLRRDGEAYGPAHRIEKRHAPAGEVRTAQLSILSGFALYAGITQALCALVLVILAWSQINPILLIGWFAAIAGSTYLSMRWLQRTSTVRRTDQLPARTIWIATLDSAGRAALWIAMPVFASYVGAPLSMTLVGSLVAVMIIGGIAVAVVPAAVISWIVILAGGCGFAIWQVAEADVYAFMALLGAIAATGLAGFLLLARFWNAQIDLTAVMAAKGADISLLLKEYEDRGAGWLWQIDRDLAFTYVSPRMAEIFGSASYQLLGKSALAALNSKDGLGQIFGRQENFEKFELNIERENDVRWVNLSGTPIFDNDGEFQGYRGVGLDITESKSSHNRLQHLANADVLTGLPNRSRVRNSAGQCTRKCCGNQRPLRDPLFRS